MVTTSDLEKQLLLNAERSVSQSFHPPAEGSPNVEIAGRTLASGLFIMSGPTASGKSTNSLALALEIGQPAGCVNYMYVMEPRAHGRYNDQLVNASLTHETMEHIFESYSTSPVRYVVIDSMTYIIPAMGVHALGGQEDVTMEKGLRRSEILGVLALDAKARTYDLTVIGTINAELFPRPQVLEGACEGAINLEHTPGHLVIRDRTHRSNAGLVLSTASVSAARRLLGQTRELSHSSFGDSLI